MTPERELDRRSEPDDDRSAMTTTIAIGIISFVVALLFLHFVVRSPVPPKHVTLTEQGAPIGSTKTEGPLQLIERSTK